MITTAFVGTVCLMVAEVWRAIVGYEGIYEVSDMGRVRSKWAKQGQCFGNWRLLKLIPDSHGCPRVNLCLRGKQNNFLVSHLVADAFLPAKCSTDEVVRHLNDNPADNRAVNLARGTYSDNSQDSIRNGTFVRGSLHGQAKLTEDNVREIRRLYATGKFTQKELGLRFGVDQTTISLIVKRQTWQHVI
jgi:hypothetical protein